MTLCLLLWWSLGLVGKYHIVSLLPVFIKKNAPLETLETSGPTLMENTKICTRKKQCLESSIFVIDMLSMQVLKNKRFHTGRNKKG